MTKKRSWISWGTKSLVVHIALDILTHIVIAPIIVGSVLSVVIETRSLNNKYCAAIKPLTSIDNYVFLFLSLGTDILI